jgi:hypothetical protein
MLPTRLIVNVEGNASASYRSVPSAVEEERDTVVHKQRNRPKPSGTSLQLVFPVPQASIKRSCLSRPNISSHLLSASLSISPPREYTCPESRTSGGLVPGAWVLVQRLQQRHQLHVFPPRPWQGLLQVSQPLQLARHRLLPAGFGVSGF